MTAEPTLGIWGALRYLLRYAKPYRSTLFLVLLASLLDMGFTAQLSLSFKYLIDHVIIDKDARALLFLIILLTVSLLLVTIVGIWRDRAYSGVTSMVSADLRGKMFEHLQRLSLGFYHRTPAGDIVSRFGNNLAEIEDAFLGAVPWGLLPALDILVSCVLVLALDWRLAIFAIIAFPLSLAGPQLLSGRAASAAYARKLEESGLFSLIQENVGAQQVVKAYGLEPTAIRTFEARNLSVCKHSGRLGFQSLLMERSAVSSTLLLQVVVLAAGGYLTFKGSMTVGTLAAFQLIFATLAESLAYIAEYIPRIVEAGGGVTRIEELLQEPCQVSEATNSVNLDRFSVALEFRNVSFSYTGETKNLSEVTLAIPCGAFAMFVGGSGSGKSTILTLAMRFYDPDQGEVLIDGRNLRQIKQDSYRAQIAAVFQDNYLFNSSIRDNIGISKPAATNGEIMDAAQQAGLHDFIMTLPDGYNTVTGSNSRFSGGQRQRLAIARALLKDPAILILDEATSALDSATESLINQTIERVARDRTVLSVTHRLATAKNADVIFVLDKGQIVETGTHEQLLNNGSFYSKLWRKQSGFTVGADGERAQISPERLRDVPILSALDESVLRELSQVFTTEIFSKDQFIIHEGETGNKFYILARGTVEVLKGDLRVTMLQDGDYFGEIALILNTPRNASIRSLAECTCLTLPRDRFQALIERVPSLRYRLRELAAIAEYKTAETSTPISPANTLVSSRIRHDLLTPVNHLVGYSEILIEDLTDSDQANVARLIADVLAGARAVQRLIETALPADQTVSESSLHRLHQEIEAPVSEILAIIHTARQQTKVDLLARTEPDLEKLESASRRLLTMLSELDDETLSSKPEPAPATSYESRAVSDITSGHLLVVDDNDASRELLCRRLERFGYSTTQASGGRQALELIHSSDFDLVLLDVLMPDIDGFEVLTRLKNEGRLNDLPVIMTSALDEVQSSIRCIQLGADDYLTKPFDPVLLRTRIRASVARNRLRQQERQTTEQLRLALAEIDRTRKAGQEVAS